MNKQTDQKGFIALMATIIISLILVVMALEEGASGFHARFNILGTEAKEQATALAEGCADQALANLITDSAYIGNTDIPFPEGTCHVDTIDTHLAPLAVIKTQAVVRGSYANLSITMNMNNIHLGVSPTTPTQGILVVYTIIYNNYGGTKAAADFTMGVTGVNPSLTSFSGTVSGRSISFDPGAYGVTPSALPGYVSDLSLGCSGSGATAIKAGELKYCIVTEQDVSTTLTLSANIINDNAGTKSLSDISLFIDGVPAPLGSRIPVSVGTHTATASVLSGYATSTWGVDCAGNGTVNIATGENKTCTITFDDNPPPTAACADTVVMLARSMSNSDNGIVYEGTAARNLLDLYSQVIPAPTPPKVGIGSYPGITEISHNNYPNAEVAPAGRLTDTLGATTSPSFTLSAPNWTLDPSSSSKLQAVTINDGNSSYITTSAAGTAQMFNIQSVSIPVGATIESVVLYAVAGTGAGTGQIKLRVASTTTSYDSPDIYNLSTTYATSSLALYSNPLSSPANKPWTLADVNALRVGVAWVSGTPRVTKIYVAVNYSMSVPGLYETVTSTTASTQNGSDIASAITAGYQELTSARHRSDAGRVLILISPSGGHMNSISAAYTAADTAKLAGISIFSIKTGNIGTNDEWALLASGNVPNPGHQPGAQSDTTGENTDGDNFFAVPDVTEMPSVLQTIALSACPALSTAPPASHPTTGTLMTGVTVVNNNGGTKSPSDFNLTLTPPGASYTGATLPPSITLSPGTYGITENLMTDYTEIFGASCSGTIAAGETRLCSIINDDDVPPPPPPNLGVTLDTWEELP